MPHKNYFEIIAKDYYDLGFQKGVLFGAHACQAIVLKKQSVEWDRIFATATRKLEITQEYFSHYIDELQGYADGAQLDLIDLWILNLQDELDEKFHEKCTSVITNEGMLIAHNEDWEKNSEQDVCILKFTIGDLVMLQCFYFGTLGTSVSISSRGFISMVNTLDCIDRQPGIPRNVIARWLSETQDPERDIARLATLPRSSGYNYIIVGADGARWNIETTALRAAKIVEPLPFVHTNHYVAAELQSLELQKDLGSTFERRAAAYTQLEPVMTVEKLIAVMSDESAGDKRSILNERTIARFVIDTKSKRVFCWLRRERDAGWVEYPLTF